jgi:hypothetical protein
MEKAHPPRVTQSGRNLYEWYERPGCAEFTATVYLVQQETMFAVKIVVQPDFVCFRCTYIRPTWGMKQ